LQAREKASLHPTILDEAFLQLLAGRLAAAKEHWSEALATFEAAGARIQTQLPV
jgi:hypothetical protein